MHISRQLTNPGHKTIKTIKGFKRWSCWVITLVGDLHGSSAYFLAVVDLLITFYSTDYMQTVRTDTMVSFWAACSTGLTFLPQLTISLGKDKCPSSHSNLGYCRVPSSPLCFFNIYMKPPGQVIHWSNAQFKKYMHSIQLCIVTPAQARDAVTILPWFLAAFRSSIEQNR